METTELEQELRRAARLSAELGHCNERIAQLMTPEKPRWKLSSPDFNRILDAVAEVWRVEPSALMGRGRTHRVSFGRQMLAYVAREITPWSYPQIGKVLGRDHTTVIYACRIVRARIEREPAFSTLVARVIDLLKQREATPSEAA